MKQTLALQVKRAIDAFEKKYGANSLVSAPDEDREPDDSPGWQRMGGDHKAYPGSVDESDIFVFRDLLQREGGSFRELIESGVIRIDAEKARKKAEKEDSLFKDPSDLLFLSEAGEIRGIREDVDMQRATNLLVDMISEGIKVEINMRKINTLAKAAENAERKRERG